jgi:hypothetical protein
VDDYENPRVRKLRGKTMAQVDGPKAVCKCDEIMAKDPTRHFRGCPKREEHPHHAAEFEKQTIQALENMGIDTSCGACMEIAFTSVTTHQHTCERRTENVLLEHTWHGKTDHERVRLLVKSILMRAAAFDGWSVQGLGMFRLYLSKEQRLHVWDPRFAVENVSTIHSHPWHFTSYVVCGRMTDLLYEERRLGFQSATHGKQKIVCGPGGGAVGDTLEPVTLSILQEVTIEEGKSYGLTADALHESIPEPGTVTIITREFREDTEHAFVCFPWGQKWVSAEPRKATMREVEAMAERALARLG